MPFIPTYFLDILLKFPCLLASKTLSPVPTLLLSFPEAYTLPSCWDWFRPVGLHALDSEAIVCVTSTAAAISPGLFPRAYRLLLLLCSCFKASVPFRVTHKAPVFCLVDVFCSQDISKVKTTDPLWLWTESPHFRWPASQPLQILWWLRCDLLEGMACGHFPRNLSLLFYSHKNTLNIE